MANELLIANAEKSIADAEHRQEITQDSVKARQQFAAWSVGIAAPGMLGLLSNAATLGSKSAFLPSVFGALFVASELLFLGSILCAILLHKDAVNALTAINLRRQALFAQGDLAKAAFTADRDLTSEEQKDWDKHDGTHAVITVAQNKRMPRMTKLGGIQQVFLLLGYVPIAVLLLSLRFR